MTRGKKGSGIDWNNVEQRRKARREYQKNYYIKYPERVKESRRLFRMKHPKICKNPNRGLHICSGCGNIVEEVPHLRHKNLCRDCYNNQMKKYQDTPESQRKAKVQQLFRSFIDKGYVEREPCQVCRKRPAIPHHPDYSKPLQVIWLCNSHHGKVHHGHKYKLEIIDYEEIKRLAYQEKEREIAISKIF